jgi:hypothetical protein
VRNLDNQTLGDLVALFAFALPCSAFCIAIALIGSGRSDEAYELPLLFRLAATAGFLPVNRVARRLVAATGLLFFSAVPLMAPFTRPGTVLANLAIGYIAALIIVAVVLVVSAVRTGAYRLGADRGAIDEPATGSEQVRRRRTGRRQSKGRAHEPGTRLLAASGVSVSEGEPARQCVVRLVEWEGAAATSRGFDRQLVADSYQEALVLGLAMAGFDPRYPRPGPESTGPVVRSRMVRTTPGNRLLRWLLPYVAGTAVCEVEVDVSRVGAPSLHTRAAGKRRWAYFGGDSESLLVDAAKLAGEHAAQEIASTLGPLPPTPARTLAAA